MKKLIALAGIVLTVLTSCSKEEITPELSTYQTQAELRSENGSPLWISRKAIYDNQGGISYFIYTYNK